MIVDINDKNISDYSKEELQNWIEYFENYQAQNISANEQNDGVIINGVPINQWKGWMKEVIKILKTYLENREIDCSVIALTTMIENDTSEDGAEADAVVNDNDVIKEIDNYVILEIGNIPEVSWKRKSSKKTIDEEMNKSKKIAKSVNNVPKIKPKVHENVDSESEDIGVEKDDYVSDKMMYDVDQYLGVRRTHRRF